MTKQQHPITPPPELVQQWTDEAMQGWRTNGIYERDIATLAAQWGADQELDACCKLFESNAVCGTKFQRRSSVRDIRDKRRPKPPSLKEQAFTAMLHLQKSAETSMDTIEAVHIICQALEQLPND
jgi:hypothetical protein